MKKYSFFFILTIYSIVISSFNIKNPIDCSKIKNGHFFYFSKKSRDKIEVERQDSIQLETNTKNGKFLKNKIVWKSDCSYDMFINALSDSKLYSRDSLIAATPASVEIISVTASYYICTWRMNIANKELSGGDTIYFKIKPKALK